MFGTDDVIYVPETAQLVFDDVYHWKRYKFDVKNFGVRVRPSAFETIAGKMRSALNIIEASPRFTDSIHQIRENNQTMIGELTQITGQTGDSLTSELADTIRGGKATWWVQITDLPAESFFSEDYETDAHAFGETTPHPTYGSVKISQLDGLEVHLSGEEKDEFGEPDWPFIIDVPKNGLTRWTMPAKQPLPLVDEYCGVHGVSAFGRTVNVDTNGNLGENHQFCTPLGRAGSLYATLYIHLSLNGPEKIMGRIKEKSLMPIADLLEKSGFVKELEGPCHRIYDRDGDVIHLYSQLPGKETEGVETMPPFMLVAAANGQHDPYSRADLFEAIKETLKR